MEMCSGQGKDGHDEVVHDGPRCPMCEVIADLSDKTEELEKAQEEQEKLTDAVKELMSEVVDRLEEAEKSGISVSDLCTRAWVEKLKAAVDEADGNQ